MAYVRLQQGYKTRPDAGVLVTHTCQLPSDGVEQWRVWGLGVGKGNVPQPNDFRSHRGWGVTQHQPDEHTRNTPGTTPRTTHRTG